jgi:hypothetical protein
MSGKRLDSASICWSRSSCSTPSWLLLSCCKGTWIYFKVIVCVAAGHKVAAVKSGAASSSNLRRTHAPQPDAHQLRLSTLVPVQQPLVGLGAEMPGRVYVVRPWESAAARCCRRGRRDRRPAGRAAVVEATAAAAWAMVLRLHPLLLLRRAPAPRGCNARAWRDWHWIKDASTDASPRANGPHRSTICSVMVVSNGRYLNPRDKKI